MEYRCHDCGSLFESTESNYRRAKGYTSPTTTPEQASKVDHCTSCVTSRNYDPVAARAADIKRMPAVDPSTDTMALQSRIAELEAKLAAQPQVPAHIVAMQEQIKNLESRLAPAQT